MLLLLYWQYWKYDQILLFLNRRLFIWYEYLFYDSMVKILAHGTNIAIRRIHFLPTITKLNLNLSEFYYFVNISDMQVYRFCLTICHTHGCLGCNYFKLSNFADRIYLIHMVIIWIKLPSHLVKWITLLCKFSHTENAFV